MVEKCVEKQEIISFLKKELLPLENEKVKTHLEMYDKCRNKANFFLNLIKTSEIIKFEKSLPYKGKCISEEELERYVREEIKSKKKNGKICRHLLHCKECERKYYQYLKEYERKILEN